MSDNKYIKIVFRKGLASLHFYQFLNIPISILKIYFHCAKTIIAIQSVPTYYCLSQFVNFAGRINLYIFN
jgi:hypothetical protein